MIFAVYDTYKRLEMVLEPDQSKVQVMEMSPNGMEPDYEGSVSHLLITNLGTWLRSEGILKLGQLVEAMVQVIYFFYGCTDMLICMLV